MPERLIDLVRGGDLDAFEARCLELLEAGQVPVQELAACFRQMEKTGGAERLPTLSQMVLENIDVDEDTGGALAIACAALHADPANAGLRQTTIDLYRRVHGQTPGFGAILASSGLTTGAPARAALRVLDFCLQLKEGDNIISRTDGRVVEVVEIDRERGLFALRRGDRTMTTRPAREVVREYERIDANDFRVLRQLHPERLAGLVEHDPVALVTGLLHAHGNQIDADRLKAELVPRYIEARQWSKWWSATRTQLKRAPHIIVEGRSPIVLTYTADAITLEDETWTAIAAQNDPVQWLSTAEGYLREMKARKSQPDQKLLGRFHNHIVEYIEKIRTRRPGEALAAALVLARLGEHGLPISDPSKELAGEILSGAAAPAELIGEVTDANLWSRALHVLPKARPEDWVEQTLALLPRAPAAQLDGLAEMLRGAGRLDGVQQLIDDAVADPIDYAEAVFWLWKGPQGAEGLRLPAEATLFGAMLDTLAALGVTLHPTAEVARHFKSRMKAALSGHDYRRAQDYLAQISAAAAVPLRRQLDRLEALGPVARSKLLELLRTAHAELWIKHEVRLAPWEDPEVLWATQAGLDRKTAERDELVNVKMHENAVRIGEAGSHGDLSENSEYKFALEERDFLRARLAQINRDLSQVRVLGPHDVPLARVGIGSRVLLKRTQDGAARDLIVLGPFETDVEHNIYNYRAPVCQKLMGLRVGERCTLTIDGSEEEFEVTGITSGLAAGQSG